MKILEFKESAARGSFDFPVEAYPVGEKHPRYVMPMHWHEEYEIIRIVRGRFQYEIGREEGEVAGGDILFVNSGEFHGGIPEDCEYRCIVFDPALLLKEENTAGGKILAPFLGGEYHVRTRLPGDNAQVAYVFDRLFLLLTGKPRGFELQVQGLLFQLFGLVIQERYYERNDGETGGKKWLSQLKRALSLIEDEYAAPLTLEQLAQAAGMSQKYFCHFFKQMTRYTPIEYLNRHRIEVACYKLMAGSKSVTELAYECGFNDLSYFIRVFKSIVGTTPKKYARMQKIVE